MKPLENLVQELESLPRSSFKNLYQLSAPLALATILRTLQNDPTRLLRNLRDFESFLQQDYPVIYAQEQQAALEAANRINGTVSSGKIKLKVTIDDIICLHSKVATATNLLNKCGHWWKIVGANERANQTRPPQWFLRSLTRKEQGLTNVPNLTFENLWIDKEDDPNYEILRVCPFPKEFNYKEYD